MTDLREGKLIESHRRAINEPAVWRLTARGRKLMGVEFRPVYLKSSRIDHHTGVSECLVWLISSGKLGKGFVVEPRYKMRYKGKEKVMQPDCWFVWNGRPYFLEYQSSRTPLAPKQWERKWELRNEFYKRKLWQQTMKQEPKIIVVSNQQSAKVKTGADFPIRVMNDISRMEAELW